MNTLHHPANRHDADQHPRALDISTLVGEAAWSQLSPAIKRRFAAAHADVTYQGSMALHTSRVGRLFALAARLLGSPLAGARHQAVDARVSVRGDGQGGVIWERELGKGSGSQRVQSTKRLGPDGQLEECTTGGLAMHLATSVQNGALVFESRGYFLLLGGLRLSIPAWFTPGICRVEHSDVHDDGIGPGRFRFTMTMTHPLWGQTFHQTGIFSDPRKD